MNREEILNTLIKGSDTNLISDGYHTFGELYEHRIVLFIALCKLAMPLGTGLKPWRSLSHSDGETHEGWFIMGLERDNGKQITYHLPMKYWAETSFVPDLAQAPKWDGHSSKDVLQRLKAIYNG